MINTIDELKKSKYFNEAKYVGKTGYYVGREKSYQCVNFVIGFVSEILQDKICYYTSLNEKKEDCKNPLFNRGGYGNAIEWMKDTRWQTGTTPRKFAIMVYGSKWGGGYGHVRVVTDVLDDGLLVSGGNEDGKGTCKFNFKISKPSVTKTGFLGYIYPPQDVNDDIDYKSLYEEAQTKLNQIKNIL